MSEIKIVAVRHPFTVQAETFEYGYVSGETVEAMMERFGFTENSLVNYRVNMNGCHLPRELWPIIEVVPGTQMAVRAIPMGGGGGGGKDPMRTVLTLAVIAATMVIAPYVAGMWAGAMGGGGFLGTLIASFSVGVKIATGLTMAALTMGGMMAVNALCPPARPSIEARTGGDMSVQRSPSLTGGQNRVNLYGPIPKILGRHRVTPPYAARPYTEVDGDNQYLRLLFLVGYGPLAMSGFRIGETAIEHFDGVEMEIREGRMDDEPITLFSNSIIEDNLNIGVKHSDGYHVRTTHEDAGEITVELTFPSGLVEFDDQGNKLSRSVEFEIGYRDAGGKDRINLCLWSRDFRNTADAGAGRPWFYSNITVSPDSATAPDDTVTMDKLVENVATGQHGVVQLVTGISANTPYCFSQYFEADERDRFLLALTGVSYPDQIRLSANLSTQEVSAAVTGVATLDDYGIEDLGAGIYRVWGSGTLNSYDTSCHLITLLENDAGSGSYTGDGSSGLYVWGAQVETGSKPTEQIKTEGEVVNAGSWRGTSEFKKVLMQLSPAMAAPWDMYQVGDWDMLFYRRLYRLVLSRQDGTVHVIPGGLSGQVGTKYPSVTDKWSGAPTCPSWAFPLATVITCRDLHGVQNTITADDIRDDRGGGSWSTCIENPATDFLVTSTNSQNIVSIAAGAYRQVLTFTAASPSTIRKTVRIKVDKGQYDVRVLRLTADSSGDRIMDQCYWTALRTIRNEHPVQMKGLALIAMRIRASERLQGMVDEFNLVAESIVDDYDAATGTWIERFSNTPSSLARHILQGPGNKRAVGDERIDIPAFEEWHDWCRENGWQYNQPIDFRSSVSEILREVCSAGRGALGYVDGKYTVIMDKIKTDPVQMFTPHNSWGFSAVKRFNHLPHGLRVPFFNEEKDWREDERIVYADGYSKANATIIEGFEVPGVTNADLIWKHGRRMMAEAKLRPEEYTLSTDVENLVCTRGDKVLVTHDVTLWGLGSGRVKAVHYDGDDAYAVTTDETLSMEDGQSYNVRFRKQDGSPLLIGVVTEPGDTNTLILATDVPSAQAPEPGDLFSFGYSDRETTECLIKSIEPQSDLTATLRLVDYAPGIQISDIGPIPEFESNISIAGNSDPLAGVGTPIVTNIRSDETVLLRDNDGTLRPRVLLSLRYISTLFTSLIAGLEVQWRPTGHDGPWEAITYPYVTELDIQGVETGGVYDFRLRYKLTDGRVTAWTLREAYTVVGMSTKPPNLPSLMIQGTRLSWEYPTPPKDHDGFKVKYGNTQEATWETAHPAHLGVIKSNSFDVAHLDKGTKVFMVKAVDRASPPNESAKAARLVTGMGDNIVENAVVTYDIKAAGFPGAFTNCEVDGEGNISALANPSMFWGQDDALFWGQPNDLFYTDNWQGINYEFQFTPDINDPATGNPMSGLALVLDYAVAGDAVKIEYRTTGAGVFWGSDGHYFWGEDSDSFWGPVQEWQTWPGRLENVTRQPYQFRITTREGLYKGAVTKLAVILDAEDEHETIQDVTIGAAGTRLTLAKTFSRITGVRLTLQDDGGTAVRVAVADKDAINGPLIKAYDKDGAATTALVDAEVQGFKGV